LVDAAGAVSVAATAEPAKPQLTRTAHRVLVRVFIAFPSFQALPPSV
jgi:hypothetical protein